MSATSRPAAAGTTDQGSWNHIQLSCVVHFYFNAGSCEALIKLLRAYAQYAPDILDRTAFILVDDGSPLKVEIPSDIDLNLLLLRINEDIPWNLAGARNLGTIYARSDKVAITDLDHQFPETTLREMLRRANPGRHIYRMRRMHPDGTPEPPHASTFFLSRARFCRLFGYDEDFAGHYGFEEVMFWRWQKYNGTIFGYLPRHCPVLCLFGSVVPERDHHTLARDFSHNRAVAMAKRALWKKFGPEAGHSRRFLNFDWHIALDRRRSTPPPAPRPHPFWSRTWWWRWIVGGP